MRLYYCWFELMKSTIPKKIPVLFSRPRKMGVFHRPKKIPLGQNVRPKKILRTPQPPPPPPPHPPPPIIKICEWGPWAISASLFEIFLQFSLPHPICSWNFEKLLDTYTYNFVCGVRGGVGPVWRWNGPETHIYCQILCIVLHTLQTLKEVWVFLFLQSS